MNLIRKLKITRTDEPHYDLHFTMVSITQPVETVVVQDDDLASFEKFNRRCVEQLKISFAPVEDWNALVKEGWDR